MVWAQLLLYTVKCNPKPSLRDVLSWRTVNVATLHSSKTHYFWWLIPASKFYNKMLTHSQIHYHGSMMHVLWHQPSCMWLLFCHAKSTTTCIHIFLARSLGVLLNIITGFVHVSQGTLPPFSELELQSGA